MEGYIDPCDFLSDWMDISVCMEEVFDYGIVIHFEYFNIFSSPFDIIVKNGECDFTVKGEPAKWWVDLKELVMKRLINVRREVLSASYDSEYKNRKYILHPCHNSKFNVDIMTRVYDPDVNQEEIYINLRIEITKPVKRLKKLSSLSLAALSINNSVSFNLYYDGDTVSGTPCFDRDNFLIEFKPKMGELSNTYIHMFDHPEDIIIEPYLDPDIQNDSII